MRLAAAKPEDQAAVKPEVQTAEKKSPFRSDVKAFAVKQEVVAIEKAATIRSEVRATSVKPGLKAVEKLPTKINPIKTEPRAVSIRRIPVNAIRDKTIPITDSNTVTPLRQVVPRQAAVVIPKTAEVSDSKQKE